MCLVLLLFCGRECVFCCNSPIAADVCICQSSGVRLRGFVLSSRFCAFAILSCHPPIRDDFVIAYDKGVGFVAENQLLRAERMFRQWCNLLNRNRPSKIGTTHQLISSSWKAGAIILKSTPILGSHQGNPWRVVLTFVCRARSSHFCVHRWTHTPSQQSQEGTSNSEQKLGPCALRCTPRGSRRRGS